ncbi:Molybdopterin adenylyltransferase [bioreactor metagenome]|uniref:Molybdopterin adenylyltransferase n=1 Tax=bioreactor metagenome TaxID=1076179 RepID=A0A645CQC0_9ZZZZ|nr:MogA/MoaB family molybdenum cofactor biosynthesis protein [Candidatus Metalachnospira sp.]
MSSPTNDSLNIYTAAVITVSDRSYTGEREDTGGPTVVKMLEDDGYTIVYTEIVPDEKEKISEALIKASSKDIALIITTGGTGFAPRDVTPEATAAVCEKLVPGIPEAMRMLTMKITTRSILSRSVAGIRKRSLIINLPGSPKAAEENFMAVSDNIKHGLLMLRGKPINCAELNN